MATNILYGPSQFSVNFGFSLFRILGFLLFEIFWASSFFDFVEFYLLLALFRRFWLSYLFSWIFVDFRGFSWIFVDFTGPGLPGWEPGTPGAEAMCPVEGKMFVPGGSRKPRRKVIALLAAGYKDTNLEAIRLTGTSRL